MPPRSFIALSLSPGGESIAIEFMQKFQQLSDLNRLGSFSFISEYSLADGVRVESLLSGQSELDVGHWAQEVLNFFTPSHPTGGCRGARASSRSRHRPFNPSHRWCVCCTNTSDFTLFSLCV